MTNDLAIGIDIGGTNIKYGFVDREGNISHTGNLKTRSFPSASSLIHTLKQELDPLMNSLKDLHNIKGIGIGAPNGNYYTGNIEFAPNLSWEGIIPLCKMFNDAFALPAVLTNDANAAALGEMMYGAAKGMRDFITITLGTGVGSGIVANGQLILGHDGFAGELGHVTVIRDGRLHEGTGLRGSLECYASATGVVRTALELLEASDKPSSIRSIPKDQLESKHIHEAAMQGDSIAQEVFSFTGKILGEALANFVMFSSPEAIVLFGGLTKAGDLLLNPVREHMEKNLLPIFQNKVKLMFSQLKESDAAILGASALVWEMKG